MANIKNIRENLKIEFEQLDQKLAELERISTLPKQVIALNDESLLIELLKEKRKNVTLEDLVLQTEIPPATLNRILSTPLNAKTKNLLKVAHELGVKIWIEK